MPIHFDHTGEGILTIKSPVSGTIDFEGVGGGSTPTYLEMSTGGGFGQTLTYTQDATPTGATLNETWGKTLLGENKVYKYNGVAWVPLKLGAVHIPIKTWTNTATVLDGTETHVVLQNFNSDGLAAPRAVILPDHTYSWTPHLTVVQHDANNDGVIIFIQHYNSNTEYIDTAAEGIDFIAFNGWNPGDFQYHVKSGDTPIILGRQADSGSVGGDWSFVDGPSSVTCELSDPLTDGWGNSPQKDSNGALKRFSLSEAEYKGVEKVFYLDPYTTGPGMTGTPPAMTVAQYVAAVTARTLDNGFYDITDKDGSINYYFYYGGGDADSELHSLDKARYTLAPYIACTNGETRVIILGDDDSNQIEGALPYPAKAFIRMPGCAISDGSGGFYLNSDQSALANTLDDDFRYEIDGALSDGAYIFANHWESTSKTPLWRYAADTDVTEGIIVSVRRHIVLEYYGHPRAKGSRLTHPWCAVGLHGLILSTQNHDGWGNSAQTNAYSGYRQRFTLSAQQYRAVLADAGFDGSIDGDRVNGQACINIDVNTTPFTYTCDPTNVNILHQFHGMNDPDLTIIMPNNTIWDSREKWKFLFGHPVTPKFRTVDGAPYYNVDGSAIASPLARNTTGNTYIEFRYNTESNTNGGWWSLNNSTKEERVYELDPIITGVWARDRGIVTSWTDVTSPLPGDSCYDTTLGEYQYFTGTTWEGWGAQNPALSPYIATSQGENRIRLKNKTNATMLGMAFIVLPSIGSLDPVLEDIAQHITYDEPIHLDTAYELNVNGAVVLAHYWTNTDYCAQGNAKQIHKKYPSLPPYWAHRLGDDVNWGGGFEFNENTHISFEAYPDASIEPIGARTSVRWHPTNNFGTLFKRANETTCDGWGNRIDINRYGMAQRFTLGEREYEDIASKLYLDIGTDQVECSTAVPYDINAEWLKLCDETYSYEGVVNSRKLHLVIDTSIATTGGPYSGPAYFVLPDPAAMDIKSKITFYNTTYNSTRDVRIFANPADADGIGTGWTLPTDPLMADAPYWPLHSTSKVGVTFGIRSAESPNWQATPINVGGTEKKGWGNDPDINTGYPLRYTLTAAEYATIGSSSTSYHSHQAGIEGEPTITDLLDGTLSVASAVAWCFTDTTMDSLLEHTITGGTVIAPTDDTTNYICADRDTDNWVKLTDPSLIDYIRYIPYFIVYKRTGSNNMHFQKMPLSAHGEIEKHHQRVMLCDRYARENGALIGLSVDASLNITMGGGGVWTINRRYVIPSVTTATRQFVCEWNGGSNWTVTSHTAPTINNTQYQGATAFTALTAGYWTINYVYRGIEDQDHLYTVLGTQEYATSALAQASNIVVSLPEIITSHAMFVGRVIVQKSATTGFITESAFNTIFQASSSITDHGALVGLADDDHTQYYNQTRGDARYVQGQAASVDSEIALFSGTGGKLIKRATGSGIPLLTSGVMSIAAAGTNYMAPSSTINLGTTNFALNRASAAQSLAGVAVTNLIGGNSTTALGSIPYQSNTDTTTLLAPNTTATKKFLRQTGTGTNGAAPAWDTLVAADVPPVTNLAGGNNTTLLGSIPYQSNTGVTTLLSPNTVASKRFLTQTGTGTNGAAPAWGALAAADLPTMTATVAGAVPTPPNDVNQALRGDGTWGTVSASASDQTLTVTDNAFNNASTVSHGFLRKLDGLTTTFLRGDGTWQAPTAVAAPAGSTTQIQVNIGGVTAADSTFTYDQANDTLSLLGTDTGIVLAGVTNEPATPGASTLRYYTKSIAGRMLPKWIGPSGVDTPFQASIGFNGIRQVGPASGTSATTCMQAFATAFTNTATTIAQVAMAAGTIKGRMRHVTLATSTTAGNVASHFTPNFEAFGEGGYFFSMRGGIAGTIRTGQRGFMGLWASTSIAGNVDPTTATTSKLGIAYNPAGTTGNWKIVAANGTTVMTAVDLGASFAINTTDIIELVMFCAPGSTSIGYRVTNLTSGVQTSGTMSGNVPATTVLLAVHAWVTNNAQASTSTMLLNKWYLESDY